MVVRKFLKVLTVSAALSSTALFAADPGGTVGLAKATFTGSSFDTTSSVMANAAGYVLVPEEMYASSLPEKTTVAWAGYMRMEAGVTYDFKGCYDDYVSVKINGAWILSKGSECQERTGSYVPTATDWYPIEFRVANNSGGGGCQNASQYGILWRKNSDVDWRQVSPYDEQGLVLFKTGRNDLMSAFKTTPIVLSSKMRENAPTVMDVTYIVCSPHDTVNVRALAFEDGERSFWKVVRPETFVNDPDGNPTAQNIGDNIPANVAHKLAWKVDSDWKTDLAKVKFEILTSDMAQLPLKTITIPPTAKNSFPLRVAYNEQTDADMFNALLWWYADGDPVLVNENGYVDVDGYRWINRTAVNSKVRMPILTWLYDKMGWMPLMGGNLVSYARKATRTALWYNTATRNCVIPKAERPTELYIGDKAYMVVDLSGGTDAASYPVSYLDSEPVCGWSDEYKTTKIVLRRIDAGKYMMQRNKEVTLTKSFYIGVYEVTQKQYMLIVGANPSQYKGNMRPVECVSLNMVRGAVNIYNWPTVSGVDPSSFMGKMQAKTGFRFDLPTEAQWEYACRAGTDSFYNNGGNGVYDFNFDLRFLGRYPGNRADGRGGYLEHTVVGSYEPNGWGLYDMHGNIAEWCHDNWEELNVDPVVDPIGPEVGDENVIRSGCWNWACKNDDFQPLAPHTQNGSFYRWAYTPSTANSEIGFRLCLTTE